MASVYGLAAMGFNVVAGVLGILNLAHADLLTLGAYLAYWLWLFLGFNPIASLPASLAAGIVAGLLLYYGLFKKVAISMNAALIASFSLGVFLQESMRLAWTPNFRGVLWTMGSLSYSYITLPITYVITFIGNLIIIVAVYFVIYKTYFGKAMRAVAINRNAAAICGVNVGSTLAYGFAFGSALAFLGGTLLLVYTPAGISPYTGQAYMAKSLVIATIGGIGNPWGALIGGILVGLFEQLLPPIVTRILPGIEPFSFTVFVYFIIFVIILVVKPKGILGGRQT